MSVRCFTQPHGAELLFDNGLLVRVPGRQPLAAETTRILN